MNSPLLLFRIAASMTLASCSVKLAAVTDKTAEQVQAAYTVTKDVPYGTDKEQTLDVYRSAEAPKRGAKNYTVVFLHGGRVVERAEAARFLRFPASAPAQAYLEGRVVV